MSANALMLNIRLEMLSDWAVGSGGGRQGAVDSLVERDADGLPHVPATTLRGIWRDAAEQAAFALDGDWPALVDHLFGSQPNLDTPESSDAAPIPSRLDLADLRFPDGFREAFKDGPADEGLPRPDRAPLRSALCFIKPGVAIEARSGRAKTDFLRFEEVARQGAVLEAQARLVLSGDPEADRSLVALALASAALVDRIGGNRRRGSGRCCMSVTVAGEPAGSLLPATETVIATLESSPKLPPPLRPSAHAPVYAGPVDDGFVVLPLDATAITPTVVAKAVLGNVTECLDHIPGTLLLSGAIGLLGGVIEPGAIAAAITNGNLRVMPAYPVVAGRRGLPAPLIMERLKDDLGGPDGKGMLRIRPRVPDPDDNRQFKSCRGRFIAFEPGAAASIAFGAIEPLTRTHNTVQDEVQKPTEDVGGVFTYEAIPAETRLRAEIWVRDGLAARDKLEELRQQSTLVAIGRAKKAGYGAVRLTIGVATSPPQARGGESGFALYLASDLLLPSSPGPDTSPQRQLRDAIAGAMKVEVSITGGDIRAARSEGWIARWGLPRPSYIVLRAGSVVFVAGKLTSEERAKLQRDGLGMRRGEGFGQILLDPPFITADLGQAVELVHPVDDEVGSGKAAVVIPPELSEFAGIVEDAALKDAIRLRAEEAVADDSRRRHLLEWSVVAGPNGDKKLRPNMSQLGAMRSVMRGLASPADLERAVQFVATIAKTDRQDDWGKDALDRLNELLGQPETIWEKLEMAGPLKDLLIVRSASEVMGDAKLRRFAIANLLHAAMRAHKRAAEQVRPDRQADRQTEKA